MSTHPDRPDPERPPQPSPPLPPGADPGYEYMPPPPPAPGYQYSAPAPGPSGPPQEALAGFWIRFGGVIIDTILISIVVLLIESLLGIDRDLTDPPGPASSWVQFIVAGAYFTYFHATAAGQTVGNRAVGIRVLDAESGGSITYARAFIRFLVSIVSGFVLLLGYLWMLWDSRNQTWHDKVANSLVVKSSAYPPGPFGRPAT